MRICISPIRFNVTWMDWVFAASRKMSCVCRNSDELTCVHLSRLISNTVITSGFESSHVAALVHLQGLISISSSFKFAVFSFTWASPLFWGTTDPIRMSRSLTLHFSSATAQFSCQKHMQGPLPTPIVVTVAGSSANGSHCSQSQSTQSELCQNSQYYFRSPLLNTQSEINLRAAWTARCISLYITHLPQKICFTVKETLEFHFYQQCHETFNCVYL